MMFLEFCGLAALLVGWAAGDLLAPLAVGYCVTAVAAVFTIPLFFWGVCTREEGEET